MYTYTSEESVTGNGNGGIKFGLNSGAVVTKFEYNPNAGAGGAEGDAIDFTVQIGEKEFRKRFFPVTKVYGSNGEITDTTSEEYQEAFGKEVALLNATLSSIVKCFVGEEDIKLALATPINSFKDYAQILERLVKGNSNWDKLKVDVFLSYQWKPSGDNDKTYLELPKNVKHGSFIVKSLGNGFSKVESEESIKYANSEGITHPFKRSVWFAESEFANQQDLGTTTSDMTTASSDTAGW